MFGIGLPELILIMAVALIVVGPEKLPELAKSLAKGVVELKKAAGSLKESLREDGEPWEEVKDTEDKLNEAYKKLPAELITDESDIEPATDREVRDETDSAAEDTEPVAETAGTDSAAEGTEPVKEPAEAEKDNRT